MAKVVTITNPVTGQPAQVDQLDHTAQQIDDAVEAARWSHRNLLDNAYFANPDAIIDQRGGYVVPPGTTYYNLGDLSISIGELPSYTTVVRYATYTDVAYPVVKVGGTEYMTRNGTAVRGYVGAGYTVDRFYKESNGVVLIEDDGITIDASGGTTVFTQNQSAYFINSLLGKTVTLSVLLTDNTLLTGTGTFPDTIPTSTNVVVCSVSSNGIVIQTVLFGAAKSYQLFRCTVYDGVTKKIRAVKLELGTVQTVAHQDADGNWVLNDPPPDKALELLKCQRYFWRSWAGERNTQNSILGVVFTNNNRITGFDYPVEMRTKPSITVYGLTGANKVTDWVSDEDYGPASPAYWDTQRCVALACDGAGLSNDNRVYYFIEANAEL